MNNRNYYRDVSVNLYSKNGTKILSKRIGDLNESGGGLNVSISTNKIPYYITFESPDFWVDNLQVNYYEKVDQFEYAVRTVDSKEELPPESK